jgi:hypothetical protein
MAAGMISFSQIIQTGSETSISRKTLDITASNVAEFIIKNPGTPANWHTLSDFNSVTALGLAQKDRVLNAAKVVSFINQSNSNYEAVKEKLNISQYDFYATFEGGASLAGGAAPPGSANISVVRRLVTINGAETKFTFTLYSG